jgi:hypothetical protein
MNLLVKVMNILIAPCLSVLICCTVPRIVASSGGGFFKNANRLFIDMRNAVMMDNPKNVVVNISSDQRSQGKIPVCLNVLRTDIPEQP